MILPEWVSNVISFLWFVFTQVDDFTSSVLNPIFWVSANVLIGYIGIALLLFVTLYPILFDPRATTGGRIILQFTGSLIGVIALVFIGVFIDGRVPWYVYPGDVLWWRPLVRFVAYGVIAYTATNLAAFLIIRKWWPEKVQTSADRDIVRPRKDK